MRKERTELRDADRLIQAIADDISGGRFRAGEFLPEPRYFVEREGVPESAVREVYSRLEEQGLIHGQGDRRVVGCGPRGRGGRPSERWPVVFVVQPRPSHWGGLGRSDRVEKFCRAFVDESEKHRVQLVPVLTKGENRGYVSGADAVREAVGRYGERYVGALIPASTKELPDLGEWVELLTGSGRPVVWFDRLDEPPERRPGAPLFTRCHFSEPAAVRLALEHLIELGHQRIGYATLADVDWRHARRRLLTREAERLGHTARLVTEGCQADLLRELAPAEIERLVEEIGNRSVLLKQLIRAAFAKRIDIENRFRGRGYVFNGKNPGEQLRTLFQFIEEYGATEGVPLLGLSRTDIRTLQVTPLLAHLLLHERVTALIAACDVDARTFHAWLDRFNLAPGEQISLIGFDNYWLPEQTPVTTVDFGFGYLGYAAFQALYGAVKLDRTPDGDIAAKPHIVYRGSTGTAERDGGGPHPRPME